MSDTIKKLLETATTRLCYDPRFDDKEVARLLAKDFVPEKDVRYRWHMDSGHLHCVKWHVVKQTRCFEILSNLPRSHSDIICPLAIEKKQGRESYRKWAHRSPAAAPNSFYRRTCKRAGILKTEAEIASRDGDLAKKLLDENGMLFAFSRKTDIEEPQS